MQSKPQLLTKQSTTCGANIVAGKLQIKSVMIYFQTEKLHQLHLDHLMTDGHIILGILAVGYSVQEKNQQWGIYLMIQQHQLVQI